MIDEVRIAGTPDNPAITGRADLVRGDYEFAGREFELSRGVIRFAGEVPEPRAGYRGERECERPECHDPGDGRRAETGNRLQQRPRAAAGRIAVAAAVRHLDHQSSAPEALQLAAVAALQDGGNGVNPINAVRRAAGLDRLRILPADPQTGQATAIAAGKYVTRRVYAEIITDGQGYSATRVEFQVTRWLSLLSSISTLGRQSANVRVSRI
ncbi:translocation/assembly module TamB domain-containing protein [Sphingomonas sp. MMS24-JH45]